MLIEFSVENYRSFRERQTFSMVAASHLRRLKDNSFAPEVDGETLPRLLKVCVIYGPNASGKSNLLKAFSVAGYLASSKPTTGNEALPVWPFRFDPVLSEKPSSFEISFIQGRKRYKFELSLNASRIISEQLTEYPAGEENMLYSRKYGTHGETYKFYNNLEGGAELHEAWRRLTSPTTLFISQAVANSNEDLKQLRAPLLWLTEASFIILSGMSPMGAVSRRLAATPSFAGEIATFLSDFDVPVSSIRSEEVSKDAKMLGLAAVNAGKSHKMYLTHKTSLGEATFTFDEESEGTKNLIGFWLPWTTREPLTVDSFSNQRCVLAVDEMDSSLHPRVVERLVERHLRSKLASQLIFTTHDTHLMDSKLLRRDQIWIAERDSAGATQLRSIHDFRGREGEDLEKRYFEGRYRGLPFLDIE